MSVSLNTDSILMKTFLLYNRLTLSGQELPLNGRLVIHHFGVIKLTRGIIKITLSHFCNFLEI